MSVSDSNILRVGHAGYADGADGTPATQEKRRARGRSSAALELAGGFSALVLIMAGALSACWLLSLITPFLH
jgi:hypothetical protein